MEVQPNGKLPLPLGIERYAEAESECYYVDKTLLIRDLVDVRSPARLFTRPRGFGKTMNLDMLRVFFEKSEEDTSVFFQNRKIWTCGEEYRREQGRYPVIALSFKSITGKNWETAYAQTKGVLAREYERHFDRMDHSRMNPEDVARMECFIAEEETFADASFGISMLSDILRRYYRERAIILIDEYDTPLHESWAHKYESEMASFMRSLLGSALKGNYSLEFGVMTGILRIANDSLFSGLNNLDINTVFDRRFDEYFGFTHEEVRALLAYYGVPERYEEICAWYGGYHFGDMDVCSPWSLLSYLASGCIARPYWANTESDKLISKAMELAGAEQTQKLDALAAGETAVKSFPGVFAFSDLKWHNAVFTLLLMAGYLTTAESVTPAGSMLRGELKVPNKDVLNVYRREIAARFHSNPQLCELARKVANALRDGDAPALGETLEGALKTSASVFDTTSEDCCHGLLCGWCMLMDDYEWHVDRESGDGRHIVCLYPHDSDLPGILIELKYTKSKNEDLEALAEKALAQIKNVEYEAALQAAGVHNVIRFGVAAHEKVVVVRAERVTL